MTEIDIEKLHWGAHGQRAYLCNTVPGDIAILLIEACNSVLHGARKNHQHIGWICPPPTSQQFMKPRDPGTNKSKSIIPTQMVHMGSWKHLLCSGVYVRRPCGGAALEQPLDRPFFHQLLH